MSSIKNLGVLNKNVSLVHSSGELSAMQRKLINVFLYKTLKSGKREDKYLITMKEIVSTLGYNSNDYMLLKKAVIGLITTPLELDIYDGKPDDEWQVTSMLASAKSHRGGLLEYSFSPLMSEIIFDPGKYAKINMDEALSLKSQYSISIYELCSRFASIKQTSWISIDKLRKLLGIPDEKYKLFKELKRRVISPAVDEINKKTSIKVSFEMEYLGGKASGIKFSVTGAKQKKFSIAPIAENKSLQKIGLTKNNYSSLEKKYGKKKLDEAIDYTSNRMDVSYAPPREPIKYLKTILSRGIDTSSTKVGASSESKTIDQNALNEYELYLYKYAFSWFSALKGSVSEKFIPEFFDYLENKVLLSEIPLNHYKKLISEGKFPGETFFKDINRYFTGFFDRATFFNYAPLSLRQWNEKARESQFEEL